MFRSTAAAMAAMLLFAHAGLAQPVAVSHPGKDAKLARDVQPRQTPSAHDLTKQSEAKSGARGHADRKPDDIVRDETKRADAKREETKVAPRVPGTAIGIGAVSPGLREYRSGAGRQERAPFAGHWQGRDGRRDGHDRRDDRDRRDGRADVRVGGGISIVIGGGEARYEHRDPRGGFCGTPVCQPQVTRLVEQFHIDGRRVEAEVTLWFDRSCGDLKGKVRLTTCDPRGLAGISASLDANQGRKNRWNPCLTEIEDCERSVAEYVTDSSPSWEVDCMQVRLNLSSHCGSTEVEWRGVRVPR
ncbi:MAG: hypothetical protein DYG92_03565 [Leptolyngbya sp. PLA1]|nr:hypothetical protein [Leptolyngbya sp. PLA1]